MIATCTTKEAVHTFGPCSKGCCWIVEYGPGHYISVPRLRGVDAPDLVDVLGKIHGLMKSGALRFVKEGDR